ncbi:MAG: SRPBCC family protein [Alphaproteobacteria bacterium]
MTETISLELSRTYDAAPERVFDAWLGKSWGEFVGPPGVHGELTLIEPRVGGRYRIVMHTPDGKNPTVGGVFREIDRPRRLVMTWKWEHEEQDTLVTLTFRAAGKGTELTLRHDGFANAERRDSHRHGWTGTLDKLALRLAA